MVIQKAVTTDRARGRRRRLYIVSTVSDRNWRNVGFGNDTATCSDMTDPFVGVSPGSVVGLWLLLLLLKMVLYSDQLPEGSLRHPVKQIIEEQCYGTPRV